MPQDFKWLPHPLMSAILLLLWLLLNDTASAGHLVLGTLLGLLIPFFTQRFWPETEHVHRPALALRFIGRVLVDIIVANFAVARLVFKPPNAIRPAFVRVPLDVKDDFAISILASVVSLTPGTVSADLDLDAAREHGVLLVHVLDLDDAEKLIAEIKTRYEAPIMEIFAC